MTKSDLLKALEPFDDDVEITVTGDAISDFYEIEKVVEDKGYNRVYLFLDSDPLFDGHQLKEIIRYVIEEDSYNWSDYERRLLEDLIAEWEE